MKFSSFFDGCVRILDPRIACGRFFFSFSSVVLADARSGALLAGAPCSVVLAEARPAALLAQLNWAGGPVQIQV